MKIDYRPAIDGLRAIAVLLVLLFHAKAAAFSGGYIGVDVFFVISGFLIATLIQKEQAEGRFTLARFYERRIRRLLPALVLVMLSTLVAGAIIMLPPDLARLSRSLEATALFVSNFYFWRTGQNYLRDDPEFEPLLHTWSLAIEEQFYLLFPVAMLLGLRLARRIGPAFLCLALASFVVSVYMTSAHPRAAFYFSPSRAWELLLGAWIAVTPAKDMVPGRLRPLLQLAGLAMIAAAAFGYSVHTPFPGFAGLLPCVGAALVLAWSDRPSWPIMALSHPALVWIGLISYPLYLWHWPALVLAKLALLRPLAAYEIAAIYGVAFGLAAATWRYVEKPVRARRVLLSRQRVFALAAATTCLAVAAGGGIRLSEGLWNTPPASVSQLLAAAHDTALSRPCHNWDRKTPDGLANCTLGATDRGRIDFVLLGDSHAGAVATAVDAAAGSVGRKGLQLTSDNCPPLLRTQILVDREMRDCEARNEAALALMQQFHIRRAILVGAWVQYMDGYDKTLRLRDSLEATENDVVKFRRALTDTVDAFRKAGVDLLILGPVPEIAWNVPTMLAAKEWRRQPLPQGPSLDEFLASQRKVMAVLRDLESNGSTVVYPHEQLCASTCLIRMGRDVLYTDSEHLSLSGADLLRPVFARHLK